VALHLDCTPKGVQLEGSTRAVSRAFMQTGLPFGGALIWSRATRGKIHKQTNKHLSLSTAQWSRVALPRAPNLECGTLNQLGSGLAVEMLHNLIINLANRKRGRGAKWAPIWHWWPLLVWSCGSALAGPLLWPHESARERTSSLTAERNAIRSELGDTIRL